MWRSYIGFVAVVLFCPFIISVQLLLREEIVLLALLLNDTKKHSVAYCCTHCLLTYLIANVKANTCILDALYMYLHLIGVEWSLAGQCAPPPADEAGSSLPPVQVNFLRLTLDLAAAACVQTSANLTVQREELVHRTAEIKNEFNGKVQVQKLLSTKVGQLIRTIHFGVI